MEFTKNGNSLILYKNKYESDEMFLKKGWFIISQTDVQKNFQEIERISKLYINVKFKGCVYNRNIMDKIEEMSKNINIDSN